MILESYMKFIESKESFHIFQRMIFRNSKKIFFFRSKKMKIHVFTQTREREPDGPDANKTQLAVPTLLCADLLWAARVYF